MSRDRRGRVQLAGQRRVPPTNAARDCGFERCRGEESLQRRSRQRGHPRCLPTVPRHGSRLRRARGCPPDPGCQSRTLGRLGAMGPRRQGRGSARRKQDASPGFEFRPGWCIFQSSTPTEIWPRHATFLDGLMPRPAERARVAMIAYGEGPISIRGDRDKERRPQEVPRADHARTRRARWAGSAAFPDGSAAPNSPSLPTG